ncbi:phosphoribosyltransferase [Hyalangium rubrum]|uniref:Phosphoribosyltransferase family protein n=1 Tax=Hyalangium rubrum TaxID=3103134 RepID=A0ABU5HBC2_9BACT|nr:phosphoribosyltransferase family protein [Hyalangium sp. s54d21]MDY7230174.1 phosphoribosyltransferase family protein [Hyalangium sp. s54d21]
MRFRDRADAGRRLAANLVAYRSEATRVFGLDGGGLRVGFEVAQALGAPLDAWAARAVESPKEPGHLVGAVSEGGGLYLEVEGIRSAAAPAAELARWMESEAGEVALAAQRLRGGHPRLDTGHCTVVLVVDGLAQGDARVYAALRGLRRQGARRVVLATPVASAEELERLRPEADEVVCLQPIWSLHTVAPAYDDFREVPDLEARQLVARARELASAAQGAGSAGRGEWM